MLVFLRVEMIRRLHLVHPATGSTGSLGPLPAGVKDHLQERNRHREQHPDVNHLDIGGDWQTLGDPEESKKIYEIDQVDIIFF